jgi:hypothetical protein
MTYDLEQNDCRKDLDLGGQKGDLQFDEEKKINENIHF